MGISWMKTGQESAELAAAEAAAQEARKAQQGKLYRWNLKVKEDAALTFVDGDLNEQGFLLPPRWYEHFVKVAGQWQTHVCPEQTNPGSGQKCPLCEQGDKPSLVAGFTVIDHRSFTGKENKVYTNQRRLFVCKSGSFEMLSKMALKRGGLAGCRFDVSRTGEKVASVGDVFDFDSKKPIEELKAKYTRTYTDKDGKEHTVCDFEPANYEEEIVYRDEMELRKLGFGKGGHTGQVSGFSGSAPSGNGGGVKEQVDYSSEL